MGGFDKLNQRWGRWPVVVRPWSRLTARCARCSTTGWSRSASGVRRLWFRQAQPAVGAVVGRLAGVVSTDQLARSLLDHLSGGSVTSPTYAGAVSDQLVVGFDLDMTLIDTVVGFAATLDVLGAELGVEFPTEELTSKLGPPLDLMLEPHLPAEQIQAGGRPVPGDLPGDRRGPDAGVPGGGRGPGRRTTTPRADRAGHGQVHAQRAAARRPPRARRRRRRGTGVGGREGRGADPSRGRHLRGRPRPRRRGSTGGRDHQRLGADRRLHPRGAGGGGHRRRAHRPERVPGVARRPPPRGATGQAAAESARPTAG